MIGDLCNQRNLIRKRNGNADNNKKLSYNTYTCISAQSAGFEYETSPQQVLTECWLCPQGFQKKAFNFGVFSAKTPSGANTGKTRVQSQLTDSQRHYQAKRGNVQRKEANGIAKRAVLQGETGRFALRYVPFSDAKRHAWESKKVTKWAVSATIVAENAVCGATITVAMPRQRGCSVLFYGFRLSTFRKGFFA